MKQVPKYLTDEVAEWLERFERSELPEYMLEPFLEFAIFGNEPGAFLCALLQNNLTASAIHADDNNKPLLHVWAQFLYNSLPSTAWGSPEKMTAWIQRGGMLPTPDADVGRGV